MKRGPAVVLAVLLLAACQAELPAPLPKTPQNPPPVDPNLINLFSGAVVTHRTGEVHLSSSALHAIDGDRNTLWSSPPGDPRQSLTISLPARTRIDGLGVSNGVLAVPSPAASKVSFEFSTDGTSFQPLQTVTIDRIADNQIRSIEPRETLALRASIVDTLGHTSTSDLPEILIRGKELENAQIGSIAGTWKVNNFTMQLHQSDSRVYGVAEMDPPMLLDGAWDGRLVRLAWVRRKQFGVAVLAVDRSGRFLNGLWWFREAIQPFTAGAWFGEKQNTAGTTQPSDEVAEISLRDRQTWPLYLIRFDEQNRLTSDSAAGVSLVKQIIDRMPEKKFRIVANEVHGSTAEQDQARAEHQVVALREALTAAGVDLTRVELVAAGRRYSREPSGMPFYILMHSRLDLEVIESASP